MKFHAFRRRRDGKERMRHAWGEDKFFGHLKIKEEFFADLNRHGRVATITDDIWQPIPGLPPLIDVVVLQIHLGYWSLTGFERIESGYGNWTDFSQSWMLVPEGETD